MEILGNAPATWYGTVHYSTSTQNNVGDGTQWTGPDFSLDWHTFGVDWQPGALTWYIDGVVRKQVTAASEVQSKRAFLMANLAVGGGWPGDPNSSTPFPGDYQIDYVLVCQ
jgi:beta-glucanase (GH16 family)